MLSKVSKKLHRLKGETRVIVSRTCMSKSHKTSELIIKTSGINKRRILKEINRGVVETGSSRKHEKATNLNLGRMGTEITEKNPKNGMISGTGVLGALEISRIFPKILMSSTIDTIKNLMERRGPMSRRRRNNVWIPKIGGRLLLLLLLG